MFQVCHFYNLLWSFSFSVVNRKQRRHQKLNPQLRKCDQRGRREPMMWSSSPDVFISKQTWDFSDVEKRTRNYSRCNHGCLFREWKKNLCEDQVSLRSLAYGNNFCRKIWTQRETHYCCCDRLDFWVTTLSDSGIKPLIHILTVYDYGVALSSQEPNKPPSIPWWDTCAEA